MKGRYVPLAVSLLAFLVAGMLVTLIARHCSGDSSGTDDRGAALIASISPGYTPWCKAPCPPPGEERSRLLFALQAALGAGVLGYAVAHVRIRSRSKEER
jgi:cobalt/nickel transport protein